MGVKEGGQILSPQALLDLIPQKRPFRFIDEIAEISESGAVGRYTFRKDEFFYSGHFPNNPITPGVILLETMAQLGVVALGIYLFAMDVPLREVQRHFTVFTEGEVEFFHIVRPGEQVTMIAEKIFWRFKKLKSRVQLKLSDGRCAAVSTLAGIGAKIEEF